jgi:hypothetical protein
VPVNFTRAAGWPVRFLTTGAPPFTRLGGFFHEQTMVKVIDTTLDDPRELDELDDDIPIFDLTDCGRLMASENMPGPPLPKTFFNKHKSKWNW